MSAGLLGGCLTDLPLVGNRVTPAVEPTTRIGGAPSVSIEAEPSREYEYLAGGDRVRVTYDFSGTEELSFADFATVEATKAAVDHVRTRLEAEGVLGPGISVAVSRIEPAELQKVNGTPPPDPSEFERAGSSGVTVFHNARYARDGELFREPGVAFESVVAVTPRSVAVTMLLKERTFSAVIPVVCRRTRSRQQ